MTNEEIVHYLKEHVEPTKAPIEGIQYRCSAYLKDGTYLPCVIYQNSKPTIDQAIKRLAQEKKGKGIFFRTSGFDNYRELVKLYTTSGNKINEYDVDRVEKSPYALPYDIIARIKGETTMAWTAFGARMKDGKEFAFGTGFYFDFFQMPDGYTAEDITDILDHRYMSTSGELKKHQSPFFEYPDDYDKNAIFRDRPFFKCFLDGL